MIDFINCFLHLMLFCSTHEFTNGSHEAIILISIGLPSLLKIWKIWSPHVKLVSDNIIFQHTYQDSRSRLYQPEKKMNGVISHQLQLTTDILWEKKYFVTFVTQYAIKISKLPWERWGRCQRGCGTRSYCKQSCQSCRWGRQASDKLMGKLSVYK